jgi:CHAT domain-containing protein
LASKNADEKASLGMMPTKAVQPDYADDECPLAHPYYWGAWVCQGDVSPLQVELGGKR